MPIGISTLCTFGQTFKLIDQYVGRQIPVIEILDDWHDRLSHANVERLKEIRSSYNVIYTVHSPILDINIASANERFRRLSIALVMESIQHAYAIEAKVVVVHPGSWSPLDDYYPKTHWSHNVTSLRKIIEYANNRGINVGVENMPNNMHSFMQKPKEFVALMDEGIPVKITLDVGHANTTSELNNFIGTLGDSIIHFHLHDNLGKQDDHMVIGRGTIDWDWLGSRLSFTSITGIIESTSMKDASASLKKAVHIFNS